MNEGKTTSRHVGSFFNRLVELEFTKISFHKS